MMDDNILNAVNSFSNFLSNNNTKIKELNPQNVLVSFAMPVDDYPVY